MDIFAVLEKFCLGCPSRLAYPNICPTCMVGKYLDVQSGRDELINPLLRVDQDTLLSICRECGGIRPDIPQAGEAIYAKCDICCIGLTYNTKRKLGHLRPKVAEPQKIIKPNHWFKKRRIELE